MKERLHAVESLNKVVIIGLSNSNRAGHTNLVYPHPGRIARVLLALSFWLLAISHKLQAKSQ
jgi:hypothetical protein